MLFGKEGVFFLLSFSYLLLAAPRIDIFFLSLCLVQGTIFACTHLIKRCITIELWVLFVLNSYTLWERSSSLFCPYLAKRVREEDEEEEEKEREE